MNQNETIGTLAGAEGIAPSFGANEKQVHCEPATGVANGSALARELNHYLSLACEAIGSWLWLSSRNGQRLRQEWAWRLKQLRLYHSPERFRSFALVTLNRLRGKWRLLKLHPLTIHTLFTVCIEETPEGPQIVKVPLCSTENSMKLVKALQDQDEFSKYIKVLTGLTLLPGLGQHCVKVTNIRKNGGYTSEYVHGPNLAELRYRLFHGNPVPKSERQKLINSLQTLIDNVNKYYRQKGEVIGDWSLNNLVFEPNRAIIFNVDAEGFYTHRSGQSFWNWQKLQAHLGALSELIRLLDSPRIKDSKVADLFRVRDTVQGNWAMRRRQSGSTRAFI